MNEVEGTAIEVDESGAPSPDTARLRFFAACPRNVADMLAQELRDAGISKYIFNFIHSVYHITFLYRSDVKPPRCPLPLPK